MFGAISNLVTRHGQTTIIFKTLKDGSLEIKSFSIKQLFQLQKRLPKWRQRFACCQKWFEKARFICQKAQNFV